MATNSDLLSRRNEAVARGVASMHPRFAERADNAEVWDVEGKRYMDMLSSYSAINHGHRHPRIIAAMTEQAGRVTLTSRAFHNDQLGPFLHVEHTQAAAVIVIVHHILNQEALAVVLDLQESQVILQALDLDPDLLCLGVFAGIIDRFLSDGEDHGLAVHIQFLHQLFMAVRLQLPAKLRRPPVLPDDGVVFTSLTLMVTVRVARRELLSSTWMVSSWARLSSA